jgi:uncharacterized protein YcnI
MNPRTTSLRLGSVAAGAGLVVLGLAAPASAHVSVTPSSTVAGGSTLLTFSVPHGCGGSPTTEVVISMPDDVLDATPTRNAFYDVSKKTVKLSTPITAEDGDTITKRVHTVTYTARTPLPDGYRDALEIAVQVPDKAGERLSFPTIQLCRKGRTAWTEVPAAGQDPESLEHPAPGFEITAAPTADAIPAAPSGTGDGWGYAGLAAGAAGVALGGAALARTRRRT